MRTQGPGCERQLGRGYGPVDVHGHVVAGGEQQRDDDMTPSQPRQLGDHGVQAGLLHIDAGGPHTHPGPLGTDRQAQLRQGPPAGRIGGAVAAADQHRGRVRHLPIVAR